MTPRQNLLESCKAVRKVVLYRTHHHPDRQILPPNLMGIPVNMAEAQLPNGESNGAAPDGVASNGTNNFALTAYSSQPTPPSEHAKPKAMVPKDFLLPDGTPDVSMTSNGRRLYVVSSGDVWSCSA